MGRTILTTLPNVGFSGQYTNFENYLLNFEHIGRTAKYRPKILCLVNSRQETTASENLLCVPSVRTSNPRSLRFFFSLSTVPYSRKIQWPSCNFLLPCRASMRTQAYCFSTVLYLKNENLLVRHSSQNICIELCMSGLKLSITKTTKESE